MFHLWTFDKYCNQQHQNHDAEDRQQAAHWKRMTKVPILMQLQPFEERLSSQLIDAVKPHRPIKLQHRQQIDSECDPNQKQTQLLRQTIVPILLWARRKRAKMDTRLVGFRIYQQCNDIEHGARFKWLTRIPSFKWLGRVLLHKLVTISHENRQIRTWGHSSWFMYTHNIRIWMVEKRPNELIWKQRWNKRWCAWLLR